MRWFAAPPPPADSDSRIARPGKIPETLACLAAASLDVTFWVSPLGGAESVVLKRALSYLRFVDGLLFPIDRPASVNRRARLGPSRSVFNPRESWSVVEMDYKSPSGNALARSPCLLCACENLPPRSLRREELCTRLCPIHHHVDRRPRVRGRAVSDPATCCVLSVKFPKKRTEWADLSHEQAAPAVRQCRGRSSSD